MKAIGWGWYYLSTVMKIARGIAWLLAAGQTMSARDVSATLKVALKAAGLFKKERPKLLGMSVLEVKMQYYVLIFR